jgi:predicted dehydrogenase
MPAPLRVGVIGAGGAGRAQAAAFARLPGVAVAAVWGRTRARAEELAAGLAEAGAAGGPAARVYDRWEALIDGGEVDAVTLATPPLLRRAPAEAALERGLHVLAEKEFTRTLEDARTLCARAARAGTVAAVSLNWRYAPSTLTARRALAAGAIGELRELGMEWRYRFPDDRLAAAGAAKPWLLDPAQGGGLLRGGGSHEFDRARFVTGWEFVRVAARLGALSLPGSPSPSPDRRVALLADMAGAGGGGVLTALCLLTSGEAARRVVLSGRDGTLTCVTETGPEAVARQRADEATPGPLPILPEDAVEPGVPVLQHTRNRLSADFVAAIRAGDVAHAGVPVLPRFADGLRLQEVFAAVERSHMQDRWVALEEVRIPPAGG